MLVATSKKPKGDVLVGPVTQEFAPFRGYMCVQHISHQSLRKGLQPDGSVKLIATAKTAYNSHRARATSLLTSWSGPVRSVEASDEFSDCSIQVGYCDIVTVYDRSK